MKIQVVAADVYAEHMPGGVEEAEIEVADAATAINVLEHLGFPHGDAYLLVLNDAILPKSERLTRRLAEGDTLSILMPLKGG